jgi:hypothetical protein
LYRYLETHRFERLLEEIDARIEALRAAARESGSAEVSVADWTRLERARERMIAEFYGRHLRLGEDDASGGAIGSRIAPPPPRRGPGGGRTFEEALASPRSP